MTDTLTILRNKRDTSDIPHLFNEQMNNIEMSEGRIVLSSYPTYMAINLIGICNAACQFCYYSGEHADKTIITLKDIRKMKWLKYVSILDLYGGVGEPLMNKDFPDIVKHLRLNNKSQSLLVTTNGQLLSPDVSDRLAGKLNTINISINAATKETYESLMHGCSWDKLMSNLEYFQSVNQNQENPTKLSLSYVANAQNINELSLLAPIADSFNVSAVGISHFCAGGVRPKRKQKRLTGRDSLYFDRQLFDNSVIGAGQEFAKYDIRIGHPPLFNEDIFISLGARTRALNNNCVAPWKTAFINPDPGGKWISCCCSINAAHMDITPYHPDQDFMKTWNCELFQFIRENVNNPKSIPILSNCEYCKTHDKSDPKNSDSQLQMMIDATEEYHNIFELDLPDRIIQEIGFYQEAISC